MKLLPTITPHRPKVIPPFMTPLGPKALGIGLRLYCYSLHGDRSTIRGQRSRCKRHFQKRQAKTRRALQGDSSGAPGVLNPPHSLSQYPWTSVKPAGCYYILPNGSAPLGNHPEELETPLNSSIPAIYRAAPSLQLGSRWKGDSYVLFCEWEDDT